MTNADKYLKDDFIGEICRIISVYNKGNWFLCGDLVEDWLNKEADTDYD